MAKSRRTCYFRNWKEFFDRDRPLGWTPSNKRAKVMCHRIERAWSAERIHRELVQLGYK